MKIVIDLDKTAIQNRRFETAAEFKQYLADIHDVKGLFVPRDTVPLRFPCVMIYDEYNIIHNDWHRDEFYNWFLYDGDYEIVANNSVDSAINS